MLRQSRKTQQDLRFIIKEDVPLNRSDREACKSLGIAETEDKKVTEALKKLKKSDPDADIKLEITCAEIFMIFVHLVLL